VDRNAWVHDVSLGERGPSWSRLPPVPVPRQVDGALRSPPSAGVRAVDRRLAEGGSSMPQMSSRGPRVSDRREDTGRPAAVPSAAISDLSPVPARLPAGTRKLGTGILWARPRLTIFVLLDCRRLSTLVR
jgi:hypothetical protein